MLIDTHCHLNSDEPNIEDIIKDIFKNNIAKIIVNGYDLVSNQKAILLAEKYPSIYVAVGYHPSVANKITNQELEILNKLLLHPKVIAVGEIGLDYHYTKDNQKQQLNLLDKQLKLAVNHHLPVIIHNREATNDLYSLLKKYKVKGVCHCFNASLEIANKFIKRGFLLGIGGIITFKNNKLKEVIKKIPLEYIVLETDSPYLTPVPFRGRPNSPKYLPYIAEAIAEIKGLNYDEIAKQTSLNAQSLFDF